MSRANPATTHDWAGVAAWNFKLRAEVDSYDSARAFMDAAYFDDSIPSGTYAGGSRLQYQLGPHMWVRDMDGYCAVVLYETEIIRYYPDGTFSVDNGGWNTPTTTERLMVLTPDGFAAYHHRKQLGLVASRFEIRHAARGERVLWPLDHSKRIRPETGEIV